MNHEQTVIVPIPDHGSLVGDLTLPTNARGAVLFAHGSGSSRRSPRNRYVAAVLHRSGFATLLIDLLTAREEREDEDSGHLRFDIEMLAARLVRVTDWFSEREVTGTLPFGYFGASTGAAAALLAAANDRRVGAIVSRGGRPDLAGSALAEVRAATLLIVGGADTDVLTLNRAAYEQLRVDKRFEVIPAATHLFEEPGALEQVATLASAWFEARLSVRAPASEPEAVRSNAPAQTRGPRSRPGRHPTN